MSLSSSLTNPKLKTNMVHIAKIKCMSNFTRKTRNPTHWAFNYSLKISRGRNLYKALTRKPQNFKLHLLDLRLLISTCSICFVSYNLELRPRHYCTVLTENKEPFFLIFICSSIISKVYLGSK